MPREPDPPPWGLFEHVHGRRSGPGRTRQYRQNTRLSEHLSAPRQSHLQGRYGECCHLYLRLPRLGLRQRRPAHRGPHLQEAYFGELELEQWGLIPVAQLDSYKGLLFATFDPEAPPLVEYLGEMAWYLDNFFDRREGGIEVIGGMHKWVIPCNWKFPAENFGGDPYHVGWSHLSAVQVGFTPGGATRPGAGGG